MTPLQMKYFDAVCRFQNISKAAASLHISQPTITIAIQSLENELGIKLFYRNGKHLLLTQEGTIIWDKVANVLGHIERLENEIRDVAHNKNHIRLGVPLQIGVKLLPNLFNEFKALHPEINLDICEAGGIEALQLIERDELDMAITNYDNNFSDNLTYKKVGENEICFCTSPQNPLSTKKFITPEHIAHEKLVMLSGGFFINRAVNSMFHASGIKPQVLLYSSQLHTIKNMVSSAGCSTFLMRQAITTEDNITVIPIKPAYFINSGIVMKKGKPIYSDEQALLDFLNTSYAKQVEK